MIRFIVDSTFCVSREYAEMHKISIVPLSLILDGVASNEGFPNEWDEFYERLKASETFPTTSQANPQMYQDAIERIYQLNTNAQIVILTIAGALSGTINSAIEAAKGFSSKTIALIIEKLKSILKLDTVQCFPINPVFGVHIGIGAIGIACLEQ